MALISPAQRGKRWALAAAAVLVVVLVALSPTFGRAVPSGEYRPPVPPDALTNGCYPLPDGVRFDFPYQVRSDGDVEGRRSLVVQYDLIDRDEAVAALAASFAAAGYAEEISDDRYTGPDDARTVSFTNGTETISAVVVPMDPLREDQIVRGTIVLDLPVVARQSSAPVCSDVTSTKRFAQDGDQ